jgi:two-component system sensor histidine kinase/response regulator
MLTGEAPAAAPATAGNVVSFPGATAVVPAEVLVVDDSDMVRRTMTRKINEYGHRVDVASSGDDAMAMLLNNRYRLVFLDVMMPGMGRLRGLPAHQALG